MRGSLRDIDICSILQLIALGQKTGVLLIESNNSHISLGRTGNRDSPVFQWLIFCVNGQVVYAATDNGDSLERLGEHLSYYKVEDALDGMDRQSLGSINIPEYAAVWLLLERKVLSLNQGKNVVQNMTEEVLFEIFSLCQGNFIFKDDSTLAPALINLEMEGLLAKISKQARQWREFSPEIQFFDQCLMVANEGKLRSALPKKAYYNLSQWADGKTPLQRIARNLNCDLVTLTKAVYPCVQRGWIVMKNPPEILPEIEENTSPGTKRVVVIDSDLPSIENLGLHLKSQGYEVTLISNATRSLSLVFQIKPNLIICAIDLPSLNGYQLCSIFRNYPSFQNTRIVLLAKEENFLSQVKAKLVGASDYWTKPLEKWEQLDSF